LNNQNEFLSIQQAIQHVTQQDQRPVISPPSIQDAEENADTKTIYLINQPGHSSIQVRPAQSNKKVLLNKEDEKTLHMSFKKVRDDVRANGPSTIEDAKLVKRRYDSFKVPQLTKKFTTDYEEEKQISPKP
jgi:hypothetical protein